MLRNFAIIAGCLLLVGCETLLDPFGKNAEALLPGKRFVILTEDSRIAIDPTLQNSAYVVPAASRIHLWPVLRQNMQHLVANIAWGGGWQKSWSAQLVGGFSAEKPLQAPVIIAGDTVFGMNHQYSVTAVTLSEGSAVWSFEDNTETEFTNVYGGGLAVAAGKVIMTTGYGDVVAIDAFSGEESWRVSLGVPIRSSPSIFQDQVIVQTLDSQAFGLNINDGTEQWYHAGINEITSVINQTTAASDDSRIFLAYNSGEIASINPDLGEPLWLDALSSVRRASELTQINTIGASPILINDALLIPGYGEQMVLFNATTGQRIWQQQVGTLKLPWVAGTLIFVLGNDDRLYALDVFSGKLRWRMQPDQDFAVYQQAQETQGDSEVTEIEIAAENFERRNWSAPVMVNGTLLLLAEDGTLLHITPQTGEITQTQQLDHGSRLPLQIVGNTALIIDTNGNVHAYQ